MADRKPRKWKRKSDEEIQQAYDEYQKALNEPRNYPCEECGRFYKTKAAADRCHPKEER